MYCEVLSLIFILIFDKKSFKYIYDGMYNGFSFRNVKSISIFGYFADVVSVIKMKWYNKISRIVT